MGKAHLNGTATEEKPAKKPRKRKGKEPAAVPAGPIISLADLGGMVASNIPRETMTWVAGRMDSERYAFAHRAGLPNAGKSTFLAHLASQAKRPIFIPSREEPFSSMTADRMIANGVDLKNMLVLQTGNWRFPEAELSLVRAIHAWAADLVLFDKIAKHFTEGASMNSEEAVGGGLESLAAVAVKTGVPIVGIRHPGKDEKNILPGSHEWRDVPRMILECLFDKGPPERRYIRLHKDSTGAKTPPHEFLLVGKEKEFPKFTWGSPVAESDCDLVADSSDPSQRPKIEQAVESVQRILREGRMEVKEIIKLGLQEGLQEHHLDRAARRLRCARIREGFGKNHKVFWELPGGELPGVSV